MKEQTLTILDWDDTLFPTTWSVKKNINLTSDETVQKYLVFFSRLDLLLYDLINNFLKYGDVVIVTHAVTKWVSISSNILPNTKQLIDKKIKVLSAREMYQERFPTHQWKKLLFKNYSIPFKNIISVGDAHYEFNALINLHSCTEPKYLKSVRLMTTPTYDELIDQIEVLNENVKEICKNKRHHDLVFQSIRQ